MVLQLFQEGFEGNKKIQLKILIIFVNLIIQGGISFQYFEVSIFLLLPNKVGVLSHLYHWWQNVSRQSISHMETSQALHQDVDPLTFGDASFSLQACYIVLVMCFPPAFVLISGFPPLFCFFIIFLPQQRERKKKRQILLTLINVVGRKIELEKIPFLTS